MLLDLPCQAVKLLSGLDIARKKDHPAGLDAEQQIFQVSVPAVSFKTDNEELSNLFGKSQHAFGQKSNSDYSRGASNLQRGIAIVRLTEPGANYPNTAFAASLIIIYLLFTVCARNGVLSI